MLQSRQITLGVVLAAGLLAALVPAQAQSSRSGAAGAQTEEAAKSSTSQAKVDDFEENRRAHTQKSKENNEKRGAE